jgi:hypothetical protein
MRAIHALIIAAPVVISACGPTAPEGECATGTYWTDGDEESPLMHPGGDCIDCHTQKDEGPRYALAGTVMGGANDVTDCNGVDDVTVEILDKDGAVALTLTSNAAGNFFSNSALADTQLPYTARVTKDGQTREMATPQTEQNCMACHTEEGAGGASGRIRAP